MKTMFSGLVVIDDPVPRDGAMQMAIDDIHWRRGLRVLRRYCWDARAVTFGISQSWREAARAFPGLPSTRRPTGGGLVEHHGDFTWSLTVPNPGSETTAIYRALHEAVADALSAAGHVVRLACSDDEIAGSVCFSAPVRWDVIGMDGRKIGGGALRRGRDALLYQGSIQGASIPSAFLRELARRFDRDATDGTLCIEDAAAVLADQKYRSHGWNCRR